MNAKKTPINGLVLIGGKSKRMGKDKGLLHYYDLPHKAYTLSLLNTVLPNENHFFAINKEQKPCKNCIVDKYDDLGPFGAILSAFEQNSTVAYLVLATDLPFLTKDALNRLINTRDETKLATTFQAIGSDFPEPLITIWEPKAFPILKKALANKSIKLTTILKTNEIKTIFIEKKQIKNINTFPDYIATKEIINK